LEGEEGELDLKGRKTGRQVRSGNRKKKGSSGAPKGSVGRIKNRKIVGGVFGTAVIAALLVMNLVKWN